MVTQPIITLVDPKILLTHPEQVHIYGAATRLEDKMLGEMQGSVNDYGILVPITVARNTPDLPDNTIISGHRRVACALFAKLPTVPVIYREYESEDDALMALVESNIAREKDYGIIVREEQAKTIALGNINRRKNKLAAKNAENQKAALAQGGGDQRSAKAKAAKEEKKPGSGTSAGTRSHDKPTHTRQVLAKELGVGQKTAQVLVKLAKEAEKQNPANPSDSPIGRDLAAKKPVRTIAREHNVPLTKAPKKAPKAKSEDPEEPLIKKAVQDLLKLSVAGQQRVWKEVQERRRKACA